MELFEEIRREYRLGAGTIQGVARKLKTHRRMVRQALTPAKHYSHFGIYPESTEFTARTYLAASLTI